jgi:hypothetical protein
MNQVLPFPQSVTHLACSKCFATTEVKCDCGVAYIYVPAGERAQQAVADNPEKSDRAIAAEVGVNAETVRRARKRSTAANAAVEKRVGKDGKKRRLPGPQLVLPDGYATITDAVKAGIELEKFGAPQLEASKKSGLNNKSYNIIRDVVLLSERTDLSKQDVSIVKTALHMLNETHQVAPAAKLIGPVVLKVWGRKGRRFKTDIKRRAAFLEAISLLVTLGAATADMTIPTLNEQDRKFVAEELSGVITALHSLQRRIKSEE